MGGRRMDLLSDCTRHGASIEVVCQRCGHIAYFDPASLREWNGDRDANPGALPFRCRCGSRNVRVYPNRDVSRLEAKRMPRRPGPFGDIET
jgi:hypothetical protein